LFQSDLVVGNLGKRLYQIIKFLELTLKNFLKTLDYLFVFLLIGLGVFIFAGGFNIRSNLRLPVAALFVFYGSLRFFLVRRKYKGGTKAG